MMNHIGPFLKTRGGLGTSLLPYFTNEQEMIIISPFVLSSFCSQFSGTKR